MAERKAEQGEVSPPPSYEEPSSSPPSYDSIFGKVQQAKEESAGNVEFAQKMLFMACCGTICSIAMFLLLFSIPIASLVIGSIYIDDCKIEKLIPIYLIVSGVFGIIKGFTQLGLFIRKKTSDEDEDEGQKMKPNPLDQLLNAFLCVWFICGAVWVYSNHSKVQFNHKDEKDYCEEICYKYAFWVITAGFIMMGLALLCCCGCLILMCCAACKKE